MVIRWMNLFICIAGMVLWPVAERVEEQRRVLEQYLIVETEWLKAKITAEGRLCREDYEKYRLLFEKLDGSYDFEISIARPIVFGAGEGESIAGGESDELETIERKGEAEESNLQLFALEEKVHMHTSDCYAGHNHMVCGCGWHEHAGDSSVLGGCYQEPVYGYLPVYHYHSEECMTVYASDGYVTLPGGIRIQTCGECGRGIWVSQHSHPCPECDEELGILEVKSCGCGWEVLTGTLITHRHLPHICGYDEGEANGTDPYVQEYAVSCGMINGWQCGLDGTDHAECSQILLQINAIEQMQHVSQEQEINREVAAIWLDGSVTHEEAELCYRWADEEGEKVILGLKRRCDTAKSLQEEWKYCEVLLQSMEEQYCSYGHLMGEDDERCEKCAEILTGIRLELDKDVYEMGEELCVRVFLQYQDGSELERSDWSSDYQPMQAGVQSITVYCAGLQAKTEVIIRCVESYCEICGMQYESKEGVCPHCYYTSKALEAEGYGVYGKAPVLTLYQVFLDGHRQIVPEGYTVSGYEPYRAGLQQVQIYYQGMMCNCDIIVTSEKDNETEQDEVRAVFVPVYDEYEMLYRKQIERILSRDGEICGEKMFLLNISVKRCNFLQKKTVIYNEGFLKEESFLYSTGGEVREKKDAA